MTERTAISDTIINFRFGGLDQGIETRPVNAQGGDETCSLIARGDGTWNIQTPNGLQWLSIQPDGSIGWRDVNDPAQPGPWETFTRAGNVLTELPKNGISRALVQFVVKGGSSSPTPPTPTGRPRLHLNGTDLLYPDNARAFLHGTDAFCAYELWLMGTAGQSQLKAAFDDWSSRYPISLLRVWSMSVNLQQNEFGRPPFDPRNYPNYYSELSPFHQFCATYGWIYWGIFPDVGLISTDVGWQQAHWDQMWNQFKDLDSLFGIEFQNEAASKWYNQVASGFQTRNPNRPWVGTSYSTDDPAYSSGTFPPLDLGGGPMGDLHPTRSYNGHILDCNAVNNVYFKSNQALIIGEPDRYGWNGNPNRRQAELSANATRVGNVGAVFHSKRGMRCETFDPDTSNLADGWFGAYGSL